VEHTVAPDTIDGAGVILSARVASLPAAEPCVTGIAICQYSNEAGFYLFSCDAEWETIWDSWHETLESAVSNAELQCTSIKATWRRHAPMMS